MFPHAHIPHSPTHLHDAHTQAVIRVGIDKNPVRDAIILEKDGQTKRIKNEKDKGSGTRIIPMRMCDATQAKAGVSNRKKEIIAFILDRLAPMRTEVQCKLIGKLAA